MAIAAAASAVVTAGLAATALAKGSDYVCKGAITGWLTTSDIKDGLAASGGQTKARYAVGNACVTDGHVVLLGDSLVLSSSPSCVEHFVSLAGAAVTVRGNVIHLEPADGEPPVLIWTAGSVSNLAAHLRQAAQLESLADSWLEDVRAAQRKHLRSLEEESAALLAEKRHNEQEIAELKNAQLSTLEEQSRARTAVKEAKEAEIMELRQRLTEETQRAEECRQKLEEQRRIIKEEARMDAVQEIKKESSHAYPNKDQLSELQELRRRLFEEEGRRKLVERQAQGLASMLNPPAVRPNPSSPPSSKINSQGWPTSPGRATKGGVFPVPVPLRLGSSSGSQPCSPAQIRSGALSL